MKLFLILSLTLLTSCGWFFEEEKETKSSPSKVEALSTKLDLYIELLPQVQDKFGFILTDKCDSLVFTGMIAASSRVQKVDPIALQEAEKSPGEWYRRPTFYPECWSVGESRSTISRDQLMGVMWYTYAHKRLDIAQALWDYGQAHNWAMGNGRLAGADTFFHPHIPTLAQLLFHLSDGKIDHSSRLGPVDVFSVDSDESYSKELFVWHMLLRAEIYGRTTDLSLGSVKKLAEGEPRNPLFQYAYHLFTDGNIDPAIDLLLNEKYWPADRLPTSYDRCDEWITHQNFGYHWEPCKVSEDGNTIPEVVHSGGDFIWLANLILDKLESVE